MKELRGDDTPQPLMIPGTVPEREGLIYAACARNGLRLFLTQHTVHSELEEGLQRLSQQCSTHTIRLAMFQMQEKIK